LNGATLYFWRVRADNAAGSGLWSPIWSFTSAVGTGTPTLLTPLNNATGVSATAPVLHWSTVTGAAKYRVQVASDPNFANILSDTEPIVATVTPTLTAPAGSALYWRVRAVAATLEPGLWSTTWRFTTQTMATAPVLASPNMGTIEVPLPVSLSWYAATGATGYRVQVSTDALFTTPITKLGITATSVIFTNLDLSYNTHYFWRVAAENSAGQSFSSVRDFTTTSLPAKPTLAAPTNTATQQPTTVTLTWSPAARATVYAVYVSTSNDLSAPIVNGASTTTTSYKVTGLTGGGITYYWAIRAINAAGYTPSDTWSFSTFGVPDQVKLTSPADFAVGMAQPIRLIWQPATRATSYRVQVSTTATFDAGTVLTDKTVTGTSNDVSGLTAGITYYWHVLGHNDAGDSAFWSATRQMTPVVTMPGTPYLRAPAYGATSVQPVTISWTQPAGPPATYWVQVSRNDSTFAGGSLIVNNTSVVAAGATEALVLPTVLDPSTWYYWRVRATNRAGSSAWSSTWRFYTAAAGGGPGIPPATPTLLLPDDAATDVSTAPVLSWSTSADAARYWLQVARDPAFTDFVISSQTLTTTSITISALSGDTVYYWRVAAGADTFWSGFTTPRTFHTVAVPSPVTLNTPSDGGVGVTQPVGFTWTAGGGAPADRYAIQVSLYPSFALLSYGSDAVTSTSLVLATPLFANTTYYWRVRSVNSAGNSAWTAASFTTAP
jgi:hypothetical protein